MKLFRSTKSRRIHRKRSDRLEHAVACVVEPLESRLQLSASLVLSGTQTITPGARTLARLLNSLRTTGFYRDLMNFLFFTTGGVNGFDQYGHFLRAFLRITSCTTLVSSPTLGCQANWGTSGSSAKAAAAQAKYLSKLQKKARQHSGAGQPTGGTTATQAGQPLDALGQPAGGPAQAPPSARALRRRPSLGAASALLDTVIGRQHSSQRPSRQRASSQGAGQ